jgi:hypothetical protein
MCREEGSQGLLAPTRLGLPRMLTNVGLARPSPRHPPGCLEPSWWTAVGGPQDEPGGRRTEVALQRDWNDRRAPSTLAAGDEPLMNSRERRVQRAFQGPDRLVCSARYPMNRACNPTSEPALEGPNDRKKGEHFSANRPPTHSGE